MSGESVHLAVHERLPPPTWCVWAFPVWHPCATWAPMGVGGSMVAPAARGNVGPPAPCGCKGGVCSLQPSWECLCSGAAGTVLGVPPNHGVSSTRANGSMSHLQGRGGWGSGGQWAHIFKGGACPTGWGPWGVSKMSGNRHSQGENHMV